MAVWLRRWKDLKRCDGRTKIMNFNRRPIIMKTSSFRPLKQRALTATNSSWRGRFTPVRMILELMQLMKADVLDYATDPIPSNRRIHRGNDSETRGKPCMALCFAVDSGTQAACFGSMRMVYRAKWNRRSWFQCADRLQRPQWCPKGTLVQYGHGLLEKIELDATTSISLQMIMA